ncbi:MAG: internal scaffolding protein [Microvirus sp.]|nr:MAG: internal scaffolding protein [Microvirus sp.]
MSVPRVYSYFDPPVDPGVDCSSGLGADQSFRDDCDINVIMARAEKTGEFPAGAFGEYVDLSDAPGDYFEALTFVRNAELRFAQLPAAVRSRFANDPYELLSFVQDPANIPEALKMGLISKREDPVAPLPQGAPASASPEGAPAQ